MVKLPVIAPMLVPGPVIINARTAPPPPPAFINVFINGIALASLTYKETPINAASGTEKIFFSPNNDTIIEVGTNLFIKYPIAAKTEKYIKIFLTPKFKNTLNNLSNLYFLINWVGLLLSLFEQHVSFKYSLVAFDKQHELFRLTDF